jgi:hypothetical protein
MMVKDGISSHRRGTDKNLVKLGIQQLKFAEARAGALKKRCFCLKNGKTISQEALRQPPPPVSAVSGN